MDRSFAFNNAGTIALNNGYKRAALELFRGALETKLVHERSHAPPMQEAADDDEGYERQYDNDDDVQSQDMDGRRPYDDDRDDDGGHPELEEEQDNAAMVTDSDDDDSKDDEEEVEAGPASSPRQQEQQQQEPQVPVPECVVRAENHLANLSTLSCPRRRRNGSSSSSSPPAPEDQDFEDDDEDDGPLEDGISSSDQYTIPYEQLGYNPYIYQQPFTLSPWQQQATNGSRCSPTSCSYGTQLTSAIIVFNLGLVHHVASRKSQKAAAFYEIAAALLSSQPIGLDSAALRVAIMNNFGVWCYENGDGESLRTCMEHLSTVLNYASSVLPHDTRQQVQQNIDWLLLPPNGGSPAA